MSTCIPTVAVLTTCLLLASAVTAQTPATPPTSHQDFEALQRRIDALERELLSKRSPEIDLSGAEVSFSQVDAPEDSLSRPWYENFDVWGFGAAGYLDTGEAGTRPNGGFLIQEATLFVEATAWERTSFFFELQTNRLAQDHTKFVRTGEAHAHFRGVWKNSAGDHLGLKVGRIDVPFGEEYLWQDAPDNPLVSPSAAYPYGFDEGLLAYGSWRGVDWIAAVTDGTDERSIEDDPAKAVNLKLSGKPWPRLRLSGSFMRNGESAESALEFGGSHIQPVGADHASTLGASPSDRVDSTLYELDAKWSPSPRADVAFAFGQAEIDDQVDAFDRRLTWFLVEPRWRLGDEFYLVARYSEIGTYDSDEGYHFDGKAIADGNAAFGYDARRFQRAAFGLGWRPNPHTLAKLEVGRDRYELIDASPLDPDADDRVYFGLEVVLSF